MIWLIQGNILFVKILIRQALWLAYFFTLFWWPLKNLFYPAPVPIFHNFKIAQGSYAVFYDTVKKLFKSYL